MCACAAGGSSRTFREMKPWDSSSLPGIRKVPSWFERARRPQVKWPSEKSLPWVVCQTMCTVTFAKRHKVWKTHLVCDLPHSASCSPSYFIHVISVSLHCLSCWALLHTSFLENKYLAISLMQEWTRATSVQLYMHIFPFPHICSTSSHCFWFGLSRFRGMDCTRQSSL